MSHVGHHMWDMSHKCDMSQMLRMKLKHVCAAGVNAKGEITIKDQAVCQQQQEFFSNQPAWLHVFIPISTSSPKYAAFCADAEGVKTGFSMWIPVLTNGLQVYALG